MKIINLFEDAPYFIYQDDCLNILKNLDSDSIDSIVTDPPYGISFMGKKWDYAIPQVEVWEECLRVLKPGGHALVACGTRTQHRMVVNIEDAGFEIRDTVAWIYGSGFPKSLDVSKAIDKAAGAEREVVGFDPVAAKRAAAVGTNAFGDYKGQTGDVTATATARLWQGWGTALKPAMELWTLARKPLIGTVAQNVIEHGTGGINIDSSRVPTTGVRTDGRFPANVIHDGSDEVINNFPITSSGLMKQHIKGGSFNVFGKQYPREVTTIGDLGSASRFFYCAKASPSERQQGCEELVNGNNHPTVKPIKLMEYLCQMITPLQGVILDPFMGSGTTGIASINKNFYFIGIENDLDSCKIAEARLEHHNKS